MSWRVTPIFQHAVWKGIPTEALEKGRRAVESAGGAVVEARQLSDLHLHLRVEIAPGDLPALGEALRGSGFQTPFPARVPATPQPTPNTPDPNIEQTLHLAIHLAHGTGDQTDTIPEVPG